MNPLQGGIPRCGSKLDTRSSTLCKWLDAVRAPAELAEGLKRRRYGCSVLQQALATSRSYRWDGVHYYKRGAALYFKAVVPQLQGLL